MTVYEMSEIHAEISQLLKTALDYTDEEVSDFFLTENSACGKLRPFGLIVQGRGRELKDIVKKMIRESAARTKSAIP
jgi:hypothetical protein